MSATVYNLILAPKDLINSVDKDDFEDEDGKLDQSAYQAEIQQEAGRDGGRPVRHPSGPGPGGSGAASGEGELPV